MLFEREGLIIGDPSERGSPSDLGIIRSAGGCSPSGNDPGNQGLKDPGNPEDLGIGEKVQEKRIDIIKSLRSPQIEKKDSNP
jgi:hypothetical protein